MGIIVPMILLFLLQCIPASVMALPADTVQQRIDTDVRQGRPVVVHVVVALADNRHQQIVPVSARLGNGQNPDSNLYWGARYGVRTYFSRNRQWRRIAVTRFSHGKIFERAVFYSRLSRGKSLAEVYLVAEAWNGKYIYNAIDQFYQTLAGRKPFAIHVSHGRRQLQLQAGSHAHLVVYIGHNGLMDWTFATKPRAGKPQKRNIAKSAVVLACKSKSYFEQSIHSLQSHPLLLTNGLMAPEAYTLDAVIRAWIRNRKPGQTREAAANAYSKYQKISIKASRWLFYSAP